jgi:hypothetical protein
MPANYTRVILPNDVLRAIVAVVEWARSYDLDGDKLFKNLPVIAAWLDELGLEPPTPPEAAE